MGLDDHVSFWQMKNGEASLEKTEDVSASFSFSMKMRAWSGHFHAGWRAKRAHGTFLCISPFRTIPS
ncbi:hypothetical protein B4119_1980 [Parageobacillus caldoxylosilyticus]|uniref:Uncharacterized protein n=1 Tax=Saccharococcus caldoxylosilyticus TaxID=81408 RepID=A0A150LFB0_9BACL|nr:hypothetical protein B4119_1980 [Parageobacillus caldoxylosilyticus]